MPQIGDWYARRAREGKHCSSCKSFTPDCPLPPPPPYPSSTEENDAPPPSAATEPPASPPLPQPTDDAPPPHGPIVRMFNNAYLLAYEGEIVVPMDPAHPRVVLTLWAGQFDAPGLARLMSATVRGRHAFSPPAGTVPWGTLVDLVESCGCAGVEAPMGAMAWDVRLLLSDPRTVDEAAWAFATPSLHTAHERACFLATDVDLLFRYYSSPFLHIHLQRSPVPLEEPADSTPLDRVQRRSLLPTPGPPKKSQLEHQRQRAMCNPEATAETADKATQLERTPSPGPRCLTASFQRHVTPSKSPTPAPSEDAEGSKEWAAEALGRQLVEWQSLQHQLRVRLEGKVPPLALDVLHTEMRLWARRPKNAWNAAWMLSLEEHEGELLLDAAGYAAVRGGGSARDTASPAVRELLHMVRDCIHRCQRGARHTLNVVAKIARAAETKAAQQLDGPFPFALQQVLLQTLELRTLRHLSLVNAVVRNRQSGQATLEVALHTARTFHDALCAVAPRGRLWSPLAPSLLLAALSMLEVVQCLPLDPMTSCQLTEIAVRVLAVWRNITQDPGIMSQCVCAALWSIAAHTDTNDHDVQQYLLLLQDYIVGNRPLDLPSAEAAEETNAPSAAACLGMNSEASLPCIGYCLKQVWSVAAMDQLYSHTERQLARLQSVAASWLWDKADAKAGDVSPLTNA